MSQYLLLTVRLHGDGQGTARFHGTVQGTPEWPPAPARVFQGLVAGTSRGEVLPPGSHSSLEWLERLPPPAIAAPHRVLGQRLSLFVPNNDADSVPDPRDVSTLRTAKTVQPSLFDAATPLLYAWQLPDDYREADALIDVAEHLYQLGRGCDAAWATGEVVSQEELDERFTAFRGTIYRPDDGAGVGRRLPCPARGSLSSLIERHRTPKLRRETSGSKRRILFSNPPRPRFLDIRYPASRDVVVFGLRDSVSDQPWAWPLEDAVLLVERLRNEAADRIRNHLPQLGDEIDRRLIGRKADGRDAGPLQERIQIVPLPSIGSPHADQAIRRFLLSVPAGGELARADVEWAFSDLAYADPDTGVVSWTTVRSEADTMLRHFAGPSTTWQTISPIALPIAAQRRRIEPSRKGSDSKGSEERLAEEGRAIEAVRTALRQARIGAKVVGVKVQREPFTAHGKRAEAFARNTRFAKERVWHAHIEFDRQLRGPLVLGDGRFLGLGVFAPTSTVVPLPSDSHRASSECAFRGIIALSAAGVDGDEPIVIARALRRAIMARVQDQVGTSYLEPFFTGHDESGEAVKQTGATHLAFHYDREGKRLLIIAPHLMDRRSPSGKEQRQFQAVQRAVETMVELRAGAAGRMELKLSSLTGSDPVVRVSRSWASLAPYLVNRHRKRDSAEAALTEDILEECRARNLPKPAVQVLSKRALAGRGLEAMVRLHFKVAVAGPVLLGRTRFLGGGIFRAVGE